MLSVGISLSFGAGSLGLGPCAACSGNSALSRQPASKSSSAAAIGVSEIVRCMSLVLYQLEQRAREAWGCKPLGLTALLCALLPIHPAQSAGQFSTRHGADQWATKSPSSAPPAMSGARC